MVINTTIARRGAAALLAALTLLGPGAAAGPARPNVVILLADDLGYGDLSCYGNPDVRTPHIDRLAADGIRLTSFYANAPECTPTRAALLTGRYQQRVGGLECAIGLAGVGRYDDAARLQRANDLGLPAAEPSVAKMLAAAGYRTALAGKWHLGYDPKFRPDRHGFDSSFGPIGGGADYFHHTEEPPFKALYRDGRPVDQPGYMTDLITEEAVRVIRAADRPLFLYVAYTAPHTPIQGPDDRPAQPRPVADWGKGTPAAYHAMIRRLDDGVGAVLRALDEKGLAGNTLVIFTSDNGGTGRARNAPLSGAKSQTREGGIRVPCLIRWPGRLTPGTESDRVGITMDLTASIARAAGVVPPADKPFDGIDLIKDLETGTPRPRTLCWRFRRGDVTWSAVRDGDLKWVGQRTGEKRAEFLYDLAADPGERTDLLAARPADARRLKDLYARWEAEVRPPR
jgi:N-acetylgalactosamine-6-sulfatase